MSVQSLRSTVLMAYTEELGGKGASALEASNFSSSSASFPPCEGGGEEELSIDSSRNDH